MAEATRETTDQQAKPFYHYANDTDTTTIGAMEALRDATTMGYFSGYDWVIRLNADVLIRNDKWMLDMILRSQTIQPNITALLINCPTHRHEKTKEYYPYKIHTDFFAIKPKETLPSPLNNSAFTTNLVNNAELSFTHDIYETTLTKNRMLWIPGAKPIDTQCRAGRGRNLTDTHVIHYHIRKQHTLRGTTCPIPFEF